MTNVSETRTASSTGASSHASRIAHDINPVIEQIHRHASVRDYKPDPVDRALVEAIVEAGQRAATSSNLQMYAVVAVTEASKRAELARLTGNQAHVVQAPLFLAWCADLSKLERAAQLRNHPHHHAHVENFVLAAVDVALVAQNTVLAAESLGLGTCYIGGLRNHPRAVVNLLGLPRLMFPIVGLTVGWPNVEAAMRPRLPRRAVLHWEEYDDSVLDDALHEYDQVMVASGIYENRQVSVPNRPDLVEAYGWMEHSARRVSRPARVEVGRVLREQGFDLE